jgi:ribosomal protein S7
MRYREFRIVETLILTELTDRVKQQMRERFKQENDLLTDEQIDYYLDRWDRYVNTFEPQYRDITRLTFAQVERLIDDAVTRSEIKGKGEIKQFDPNDDMIYNRNNLTILKGDLREKCINYGQGYTWCISRRDASNMFYTYRMRKNEPMFYFVFDKDRPRKDVWHAVVIYVDSTGTYHVATANNPGDVMMTWDQIVRRQPKLKGLQQLFVHQPLSSDERSDYEKYGKPVGLEKYRQFSLREKLKYIHFGNYLDSDQQDATPKELIGVYAKLMPTSITLKTWNRLNPSDRRKVEEGQLAAVRRDGHEIDRIIHAGITPSEPVQLAAVKKNVLAIRYIVRGGITPSEAVQLAAVQRNSESILYIILVGITPSAEVRQAAMKNDGSKIKYIVDAGFKLSEPLQLAAVQNDGRAIEYIVKGGITPSEAVQLAAVRRRGFAIRFITKAGIKPSEPVQLAAVRNKGDSIHYIIDAGIKPSEAVQLAAARKSIHAINYIIKAGIKPSEAVQIATVKRIAQAIEYIIEAGITPSESVQLAAVKSYGIGIRYIIGAGITPSEAVQLAAVSEHGGAINYIIKAGITPSEAVQIAAVSQHGGAIDYIIQAGITPSAEVRQAAKRDPQ